MAEGRRRFLILGSRVSESVSSKLDATSTPWQRKSFHSGKENWFEIGGLIDQPDLAGVIATLPRDIFERLDRDRDATYVRDLLTKLGGVPHMVLVHEAVFGGAATLDLEESDDDWDQPWNDAQAADYFGIIDEAVRLRVLDLLESFGITATIYKRNAEASLLAVSFIDDQQDGLIFRIYIPAGRIFEDEGAQLMSLFHDWLTSVKGLVVRQGGYDTGRGRVIEFYTNDVAAVADWPARVSEFQTFVSMLDDTKAAELMLTSMGIKADRATDLVSKYAKASRRIQVDIKHERERKALSVRQQLEAELVDEGESVSPETIAATVEALIPMGPSAVGEIAMRSATPSVQINQQFIGRVEGIVANTIAGNAVTGLEAEELARLIAAFGGDDSAGLSEDLREVSDPGAPKPSKLKARQRLKAFLIRVGEHAEKIGVSVLQKWIDNQLGL
jgi:hypothetical protein